MLNTEDISENKGIIMKFDLIKLKPITLAKTVNVNEPKPLATPNWFQFHDLYNRMGNM